MMLHLSPRMKAIAEAVPVGARVIDVGTDHAMIPVWLIQTKRAGHVLASDLRSGPLTGARALIRETGTGGSIELRLTDGLSGFTKADGDTVIIAGMGGETMVSILSAAPWTKQDVLLILAPQSKQDVLRRFLLENGYHIVSESLVRDAGRIYPIMTVQGGKAPSYTPAELHTGLFSQISEDELFGEYLAFLKKRAASAAPFDENAAALLAEYRSMEERWKNGDGRRHPCVTEPHGAGREEAGF